MAEYSRLASGKVISNGGTTPVIIPFIPNFIEISNSTRAGSAGVNRAWWETDMGQGAAFLTTTTAGTPNTDTTTFITSGGFSTFSAGLSLQYGPVYQHTGSSDFSISLASPAVVTTTSPHGLVSGNVIIFQSLYQTPTTGMPQICDIPFAVTVLSSTTFSIPWNTNQSNYTLFNTASSVNNIGSFKQILFPALYVPGVFIITALSLGSSTVVTTTAPHQLVVGQEVAFRISSPWGTTQLNSLPNVAIPGSPIYGYVTAVNSSTQVTVNINSTGYTPFNTNLPVAGLQGISPPQIIAAGDINSGSNQFGYNPPTFYPGYGTSAIGSINGPAIAGAFINTTSQGFIIGASVAGVALDVLFWRAYMSDLNL